LIIFEPELNRASDFANEFWLTIKCEAVRCASTLVLITISLFLQLGSHSIKTVSGPREATAVPTFGNKSNYIIFYENKQKTPKISHKNSFI
jgi:hypothetical protein